ncbi:parallel beta helix pectate lyase-like protein [Roseimicrobium gellanilyticum]|uniref:Parallel beta helix pectate lyase-like protein n=1 Tax=Roseimicrobium gellanilyticum TaxID=748857 RepID=A0A366HNM7_9BACT|nr:right-handed parallel beta-helix repeat-containing protein [Roseimicrobium gellanilyticum]RBP44386.1 parallel beta helix pectate lyase-like protein [Roseimicrobium gellanilyticum]
MRHFQTCLAAALVTLAYPNITSGQAPLTAPPSAGVLPPKPGAVVVHAAKHATLQEAFDAVPDGGGVVLLPPGNFEITQPLRVKTSETRIVGAGAATCIINKNDKGEPALIIRPANLDTDKKAVLWRVQLADFRIMGQEKSGDGIVAEKVQEIYLEGMSVDHHGGNGLSLLQCFEDARVADCIFTYNKTNGINIFDCHDIVVNANHFEENQDALRCVDSFNLCMNGNNIDDHLRHGVIIENTYGSVVSGNMIEECNGTALILDRDCYGITLSANVIAHHLEGGIDLRDAHGCGVSANTFTIAHKFSVRVSKDSGRNTISANNFCNTYIGGGKDKRPAEGKTPMSIDEGTGVLLEGAEFCSITGNTFSGLSTAAIWSISPCRGLVVSSNVATDCGRKLPKDSKWIALDDAKASVVKDNVME